MSTALFIRHKAHPGKRVEVRRIWEKYVKPRAASNPQHQAYYFCYDQEDPNVISVFQLYSDVEASRRFISEPWYNEYLRELHPFTAERPTISMCDVVWAKDSNPQA
jgi:quinol monooxygenase YgiN